MSGRFEGKIAWVTGADMAVASAVAEELYKEGASLLLSGVGGFRPALDRKGQRVVVYPTNPLTEEEAEAAIRLVERVDLVVTGVRAPDRSTIAKGTAELFDGVMRENLVSVWCALRAVAGKMGKRGTSTMLVLSSIHGEKPSGCAPLFGVANGALNILVKEAAQDLGRLGYRVNMLRYGPIEGDEAFFQSERSGLYHGMDERVPRGQAAKPVEIARAALMLLSEDASFINGAVLVADGGFLGHYLDGDSGARWDNGFARAQGGGEVE